MTRDEIRERVNHNKYSYLYGTYDANNNADDDVDYLLSECERLERDKDLKDYRLGNDYQKATLLIEQLSARVKELEEGIQAYLMSYPLAHQDELKKLIEKEKP
jgi:hypothetical protein